MKIKQLLHLSLGIIILSFAAVSCGDDDNPVNNDDDDDTEEPIENDHPYADDIRENGVILPTSIDEDMTLSADSVYYIDGYVYQESGTLTIEPGTVILAFEEPSEVAEGNESSLIITRNAQIDAQGTPEEPIIFTSEFDGEPFGETITLNQTNSKLWAGLIVLGQTPIDSEGANEVQIEGIPDGESRALYGGDDPEHSSGIMQYVSIRFTGAEIGPGDEIQGLTLGGVGSGTTLEFIDIFVSADDGIEIFGGTVDIRNISVSFAEDDSFDFDLGWSGTGQYLFALQGGNGADHGGEWDGGKPDNNQVSYSTARLYNSTFIGLGLNSTERDSDAPAVMMRDGSAYSLYNSIVTDFNGLGIQIEDLNQTEDSYDKTVNDVNGDNASIAGNMWYTGNASSIESMISVTGDDSRDADGSITAAWLNERDNIFEDPQIAGISRRVDEGNLDPRPGNPLASNSAVTVADDNVEQTSYIGAFDPSAPLWIEGWTTLARYGYLAD
ncbi:MAG: hypothetical protein R6V27_15970 [Balneolaceae bacterium]